MIKIFSLILACVMSLSVCNGLQADQNAGQMTKKEPVTTFVFDESENVINVSTMSETELETYGLEVLETVDAYASLENSVDGITAYCELTPVDIEVTEISGNEVTYETTYSVDVYEEVVEEDGNTNIEYKMGEEGGLVALPCYTKSNSKADSSGTWRANTTLTYTVSYEGTVIYVQLTKVSGGWERLANGVSASDRTVMYGSLNQRGTKYPTSNSFSYATGFSKDRWASVMAYGCTTSIKLSRGTGYDPWYLTMTCNIGENDIDL